MKLYVAITDSDWFNYLSELRPDEINFWQPSGSNSFQALAPREPLLFKLHSPNDFIVGGGFFSYYAVLPASFAWSAFGPKNGAATEAEMRRRIEKYRRVEPGAASDYSVGCILLQAPFFFSREEWLPVPGWHRSIVRGKGFSTDEEVGNRLWAEVQLREAFPYEFAPKYLIFDRDAKFDPDVVVTVRAMGSQPTRTSFQSPWQNGVAERWIGSCRRDLLDHVIVLNERHLRRLLAEYVRYYHEDRTHLGLGKETPHQRAAQRRYGAERVVSRSRLGGLHHRYDLAA